MPSKPPADSVPPVEPAPVVPPAPLAPPIAAPDDPYAQAGVPGAAAPGPVAAAYAPAAYTPGYYAPQPPKSLAIASLVTGIAGAFFSFFYGFGFLPSLAAVITGHLARKRQPYARGMWLAGLITGYIGLAISVLWFVGIILFIVLVVANPQYNSGDYSELPS